MIRHVEWLIVDVDLAGALVELDAEGDMSVLLEEQLGFMVGRRVREQVVGSE